MNLLGIVCLHFIETANVSERCQRPFTRATVLHFPLCIIVYLKAVNQSCAGFHNERWL